MNHATPQTRSPFCYRDDKPYSEGAYVVESEKTRDAQTDKLLRCKDGNWTLESETKYCAISGLIYSQGAIAKKGEQWMRCDKGEWQVASLK